MSTNPNTVKSQHEITNEGGRKSDVLLSTIEELEKTKKQLDIAVKALDSLRGICFPERAEKALKEIEELNEIPKQE